MPEFNVAEFNKDMEIGVDLDEAFRNQGSLYAYYAQIAADAAKNMENKKLRLDIIEARLSKQKRKEYADAGTRCTEKVLTEDVSISTEYIKARVELNEARALAELLKSCLEALKQRKEMIVQLGAAAREEAKGDLRMSALPSVSEAARKLS